MRKNRKKESLFEVLLLNNEAELKKFLFTYGKQPKPRCPITFMDMNDIADINYYGSFAVIN